MLRFVGAVLSGGMAGVVLVSIIVPLFHMATDSPMLRDGQYVLILMYTVPVGWVLGASAAVGRMRQAGKEPQHTRLAIWLLMVGGIVASPFLSIAGLMAVGTVWRLWHAHG